MRTFSQPWKPPLGLHAAISILDFLFNLFTVLLSCNDKTVSLNKQLSTAQFCVSLTFPCSVVFHITLYSLFLLLMESGLFPLVYHLQTSLNLFPGAHVYIYLRRSIPFIPGSGNALSKYMCFFSWRIWYQTGFQKGYTHLWSYLDFWILANVVDVNKVHLNDLNVDGNFSHEIRRWLLLGRKAMTNLDSVKNQRHHFADKGPYSQGYGLPSSHVRMWKLDSKEGGATKSWCVLRSMALQRGGPDLATQQQQNDFNLHFPEDMLKLSLHRCTDWMIFSSESAVHGFVHFPVGRFIFFLLLFKVYFYLFIFGTWALLCWPRAFSGCCDWGPLSSCGGFSCCWAWAPECRGSVVVAPGPQAPAGRTLVPRPGLESVSPVLADGFVTTGPPGKSHVFFLLAGKTKYVHIYIFSPWTLILCQLCVWQLSPPGLWVVAKDTPRRTGSWHGPRGATSTSGAFDFYYEKGSYRFESLCWLSFQHIMKMSFTLHFHFSLS